MFICFMFHLPVLVLVMALLVMTTRLQTGLHVYIKDEGSTSSIDCLCGVLWTAVGMLGCSASVGHAVLEVPVV